MILLSNSLAAVTVGRVPAGPCELCRSA